MLTEKLFDQCMAALLAVHQIPQNGELQRQLYVLMRSDFADEEFAFISGDICRTERLYGKYPTPDMFYGRKVRITADDERDVACLDFCNKVQDYLSSGYISGLEMRSFADGLTDTERSILASVGGISSLWREVHRDFNPRSMGPILSDLRDRFLNAHKIRSKQAAIEAHNAGMIERVDGLLSGAIRRLS